MNIIKLVSLLVCLLVLGCTSTHIIGITHDGSIYKMDRISFLQKNEMARVKLGDSEMEGYKNDGGMSTLSAIIEASVKGALQSVNPVIDK